MITSGTEAAFLVSQYRELHSGSIVISECGDSGSCTIQARDARGEAEGVFIGDNDNGQTGWQTPSSGDVTVGTGTVTVAQPDQYLTLDADGHQKWESLDKAHLDHCSWHTAGVKTIDQMGFTPEYKRIIEHERSDVALSGLP